jgi:hypothetical protein
VPKTIVAHDGSGGYIAGLHDGNTSARPRPGTRWCPCRVEVVERMKLRAEPMDQKAGRHVQIEGI